MRELSSVLVTGGAGFIGSAVVRALLAGTAARVTVVDKLTYAGHEASLAEVSGDPRLEFHRLDIRDRAGMDRVMATARPNSILHLAAESHVDRAIDGPAAFMETNIIGTYTLLEAALGHWRGLGADAAAGFRFHHVSTDEVFGSLGADGRFAETTPYDPSSPYSASKAASDHLARAWGRTYGLPVLVTNCSNNYGPRQYPEKFIPLLIEKARRGEPLPVYGDGGNVRDWLYVDDHADALLAVLRRGRPGETYNIGGDCERRNIDVARALCAVLDELAPGPAPHGERITFVTDRPGHDRRYAIDAGKIKRELGWTPKETFEGGLRKTVAWYLDNGDWVAAVSGGDTVARRGLGTGEG